MDIQNCARGFTGLRIAWCATWFDMNVWDSICWMYQPLEIFWIVENIKRLKLECKNMGYSIYNKRAISSSQRNELRNIPRIYPIISTVYIRY